VIRAAGAEVDAAPRQRFLVTGGASGLGAATVRMVVGAGGRAVIADLKEAEGHALAKELGDHARFVRCDVTDEASATAAVRAAVDGFGGLQGLVNCAGIVHAERIVGKEGPHTLAGFRRASTSTWSARST
jgi:NAD(P)-dependent dehydrogenase (short-subunit alcohol dehydrogenase family)